jgi:uncharacterized protein (TIGR02118 family)
MVKLLALVKRKEGVSPEEFSRYWHDEHGPLIVRTFPQIRKYVQNHSVKLPGGREPQIDGVVEVWLDDLESWQSLSKDYLGEKGKAVRDDELQFIDPDKLVFFVCEEKVIKS